MDVIVIGGGAAGMAAALTAARRGHRVRLLEAQERVGRKLLATGNGRCNLTNLQAGPAHYHGAQPGFVKPALERFPVADTLRFFRELGLFTVTEDSGKVYPLSDQAGSVLDVLRFAVEQSGVEVLTGMQVNSLAKKGSKFRLQTADQTFACDKVILCCGGLAAPKLGGSKSGYQLLESLGHSCTKLYPTLVQLRTDTTYVRSLKGVRGDAGLTLKKGDRVLQTGAGEVQFTDYGVSGPAVFELSRAAVTAGEGVSIVLDLMRQVDRQELLEALERRQSSMPGLTLENLLTGMVHNRLGRTLLRYAGFDLNRPVEGLTARDRRAIADAVKGFALTVTGNQGMDGAQVTAGGIRTGDFDPETMESRLVPGLFAAGEVLDIDGDCGGFNLQWAWSSGRLAGESV